MTVNMIAEVMIETCAVGHVHLVLADSGDGGLHAIFTPKEAYDLAALLMRCAAEADKVLRAAAGDPGSCALH